jgi:hypothetical protein
MNVYISGPITGIEDDNKRGFEEATQKIKNVFENTELWYELKIVNPLDVAVEVRAAFDVINEHRINKLKPIWGDYMRADICAICFADYIFVLKGWEYSKGATLEQHVASEIGIPCFEDAVELFKAALEKKRAT